MLTRDNQLRRRVRDFASRVLAVIDTLDFDQKQTLLRLVVEQVHVTGWHVQIRLRIPLDDTPGSAQSRRGLGLVLRSMATSWRSTSSSMFLDDEVGPSSISQPSSWMKIR